MAVKTDFNYSTRLQDDLLRDHLRQGHTLVFRGLGKEWQLIERQVERLGFGQAYFVSQLGTRECSTKLTPAAQGIPGQCRS